MLEQRGQLGVAIWDVTVQGLALFCAFSEGCDDLAQGEEGLVDVDGLFGSQPGIASLA